MGLVKAAKTYNENRETKFSTYACVCMDNEVKKFLKKKSRKKEINLSTISPHEEDKEDNQFRALVFEDRDNSFNDFISLMDVREFFKNIDNIQIEEIDFKSKSINKRNKIIFLLYISGYKQQKIADEIGLTQSYVSRIIKKVRKEIIDKIA